MAKKYNSKTRDDKEKEVNDLLEKAKVGIENCFSSPEQMMELAKYMSKFYNYSFRNTFLINEQFEGAMAVGSYAFWKEKGFTVNKGEKGIKILVPNKLSNYFINSKGEEVKVSKATDVEKKGIARGDIKVLDGKIVFNQGYVFEVSQTNAKAEDLPKIFPNKWLDGEVKDYEAMYMAMKKIAKNIGVKIIEAKNELGAVKGVSYPFTKEVALNPRNTELQNVKTLIHELAHAKLHTMETRDDYSVNSKEFQAELTAYTVCSYFGIDTSEYSFRYIKGWTDGIELKDKEKLLNEVRETTKEYIEIIEENLINNMDRELEKTKKLQAEEKLEVSEKSNEVIKKIDIENIYEIREEEKLNNSDIDKINIELDRDKEYIINKDLNLEDGSFIEKGTSFLVEGFENGKHELHFSMNEGNKYIPNDGVGDGYYFNDIEISQFANLSQGEVLFKNQEIKIDDVDLSIKDEKQLEFESMREDINKLMETNYENFIKSIISIEKEINDNEILDKIYNEYREEDFNLINDKFEEIDIINDNEEALESIDKLLAKRTVEIIYSECDSFKQGDNISYKEALQLFKKEVEYGAVDKAVEFTFSLNSKIKYNEEFIIDKGTTSDLTEALEEKISGDFYLNELVDDYLDKNGIEKSNSSFSLEKDKNLKKEKSVELEL